MATYSTHFNFYLPAQGDGILNGHTWGLQINDNFEHIDSLIHALTTGKAALPEGGALGQFLAWPGVAWEYPPSGSSEVAAHHGTHAPGGSDAIPWMDVHGRGTTEDLPEASPENAGYTFFLTDLKQQVRSNGEVWEPYEGAGGEGGSSGQNVQVNGAEVGTDGIGVISIPLGVPPTSSPVGVVQLYADAPPPAPLVPKMTGNTTPSGVASCLNGYDQPFMAFTNNTGDQWRSQGGLPTWIQYQFPAAQRITQYQFSSFNDQYPGRCPKSWVLQGSTDGSNWTDLDTRTNVLYTDLPPATIKRFNVASPGTYQFYRLQITANGGDGTYSALSSLNFNGVPNGGPQLYIRDQSGTVYLVSTTPLT